MNDFAVNKSREEIFHSKIEKSKALIPLHSSYWQEKQKSDNYWSCEICENCFSPFTLFSPSSSPPPHPMFALFSPSFASLQERDRGTRWPPTKSSIATLANRYFCQETCVDERIEHLALRKGEKSPASTRLIMWFQAHWLLHRDSFKSLVNHEGDVTNSEEAEHVMNGLENIEATGMKNECASYLGSV